MPSTRQLKVARLLQKELSDIFQRDSRHLLGHAFVTVTRCEVSPDLSVAKFHLSFLMTNQKAETMKQIEIQKKNIRQQLGARIRHQLRIVPELVFLLDEGAEYAGEMEQLLSKLNIPKEDKE
ncbi:MAG TPA: 30S ribosome-binding factor RbfA [Cytophagales bacterium]|jgi:ribosome-binding factor A|nr:30S ribosome-binding factor RbfA [Cytophagales bacterium]